MAAFVSYKTVNDKIFDATVKRGLQTVRDLRPAFRLIANDFYLSQKAIFRLQSAGGYPDFKGPKIGERRAAPLAPEKETARRKSIPSTFDGYTPYQYYKEKETGFAKGYPLLKRTGALERSETTGTSRDSILNISKVDLEIGTDLPYAHFHQDGGPIIPQRKHLFIAAESRINDSGKNSLSGRLGRWNNILNNYILRAMGARVK